MSKVTMPEPVAKVVAGVIRYLKNPGEDIDLITTDQAEAYKDACVREGLELAAKEPRAYAMALDAQGWGNRFPDELTAIFNAAPNMEQRIRALILKGPVQQKAEPNVSKGSATSDCSLRPPS